VSFESQVPSRRARRLAEEPPTLLPQAQMRVEAEQPQLIDGQELFMAGHNTVKQSPDTQVTTGRSELVVDLPQGQKLTIKDISPGTIIEVASWSGKSGPNERAIRMLFGAAKETNEETDEDAHTVEEDFAMGSLDEFPANEVRDETGVEGVVNPNSPNNSLTREKKKVEVGITSKGGIMKRIALIGGVILAIVGLVFGLRAADILYLEHPQGGITTGLGPASSALVAVSPQADISPSSTVLVKVGGETLLVAVAEVGGDQLLVTSGNGKLVVSEDELVGRVLFVIPFLGYLSPSSW